MTGAPSKIIVGITQRVDKVENRSEIRDALDQRLVQWVNLAGFQPVPVPNVMSSGISTGQQTEQPLLEEWLLAIHPGALLLSGGNDIGEYSRRDATERYLLSWAAGRRIPVLGICRGMQMMAVWAGTELVKVEGHVKARHCLAVPKQGEGWPGNVNSYHNWGLASCPAGFEVAARAENGGIEAIRHLELPWEGWMWHPEREPEFSTLDLKRFKALING